MNKYEMVVVFKPKMEEEERKTLLTRLTDAINADGNVEDIQDWGEKKLAYEINYIKEGYYYLVNFEAAPTVIAEVERRARIIDQILRYLTVRKDA